MTMASDRGSSAARHAMPFRGLYWLTRTNQSGDADRSANDHNRADDDGPDRSAPATPRIQCVGKAASANDHTIDVGVEFGFGRLRECSGPGIGTVAYPYVDEVGEFVGGLVVAHGWALVAFS